MIDLRVLCLLVLCLATTACGDENEPRTAASGDEAAAQGLTFVDGFEAAVARANSPDDLIFVYVGRHVPLCPACHRLETRLLSQPEAAELGRRWIAARILGGADMTPDAERFMRDHGVQGFPTLMAMTAGGEVIDGDLLGDEGLKSASELVAAMERAQAQAEAFKETRDALLAKGDVPSLEELAKRYAARQNGAKAIATYAMAVEKAPTPERYEALARWARELGQTDAERKALDHLIETWPEHEREVTWRIARAVAGIPTKAPPSEYDAVFAKRLAALDALRASIGDERGPAAEAEVRMLMADMLEKAGRRKDARVHLEWIVEHAADSAFGPLAHLKLARQDVREGDYDSASHHAGKAIAGAAPTAPARLEARSLLASLAFQTGDLEGVLAQYRAIVADAPDSPQAEKAREEIPQIEAEMAEEGR